MSNNIESRAQALSGQSKVFTFNASNQSVRVQMKDGEPWFVAKDVCDALEIENNRNATARLDDDEKGVSIVRTSSGDQQMTIVNESGLYNLIFQSRKPEARKFRKWVTMEILPTLRKTGRYDLKRRRCLPFEKSDSMCRFFSELTKWTTPADEKMVAEMMNVGVKHVHEVVRGRSQSYGVCCLLVEFAKENRVKGVQRQPRAVSRDADMKELMLEFVEFNGEEE